jgi:hypothetical protein
MRGELATAISRALTSVAIFAQLLLLFTPLLEVREGDVGTWAIAVGVTTSGAMMVPGQQDPVPPHNATTCPACIAQSLHARLEPGVRLPTLVVAQSAPVDLRAAFVPHHGLPSRHHSRAPPVVS